MLITLARKPLGGATVVQTCLTHGTGALNIEACRVESGRDYHGLQVKQGGDRNFRIGSPSVVAHFPIVPSGVAVRRHVGHSTKGQIPFASGAQSAEMREDVGYGDSGSAARFFKQFQGD